jgi:16S rRNA processing protein RimM
LVPFFIEQFTLLQKGYVRLKLQDVDNEFEAGRLVNARLYLPLEVLPDLGPDKFYYHEIIGFMLLDKTLNEVGKIIEVMDIPGNPQAICKVGEETVYIPLSDYFYCGIDKTKKEVYVDLPDGLVDVNLGDAGKDA